MNFYYCNEKGMRFESATVPAAVKPDPAYTGWWFSEIPATVPINRDGKASENRDKSEDLPETLIFNAFGKKSEDQNRFPLISLQRW